jgi:hypothetical protein
MQTVPDAMKEIEKCRQQQQQTAVWLDERQAFMDASVQEFKTQQQALQTEQVLNHCTLNSCLFVL